jgi:hypothetical protein
MNQKIIGMKITIYSILVVFVFAIIVFSCKKAENKETKNALDSKNPIEDVIWIKKIKNSLTNCTCEISIIQGTYNSQIVFFTALTDHACDGIDTPTLYDCYGNVVRTFTMDDYQDFYDNVSRDKVLYRCKKDE